MCDTAVFDLIRTLSAPCITCNTMNSKVRGGQQSSSQKTRYRDVFFRIGGPRCGYIFVFCLPPMTKLRGHGFVFVIEYLLPKSDLHAIRIQRVLIYTAWSEGLQRVRTHDLAACKHFGLYNLSDRDH